MEKPNRLSVIQGLHLYLVEARVGQCDSTHIAFCKIHSSMNPKEKRNVHVCVAFVGSRPFAPRCSSHDFNQYFQLFKNSVRDMTDKEQHLIHFQHCPWLVLINVVSSHRAFPKCSPTNLSHQKHCKSPKLVTTICPLTYTDVRNCFTRFSTT